jgi:hypothetical protein
MIYPHEINRSLPEEAYFMRIWSHYRDHMFKLRFAYLVSEGVISKQDAEAFKQFADMSHEPTFTMYIHGKLGLLPHL